MIRLVLFDIDGTLISTAGCGVRAFRRTFEMFFGLKDATAGVSFGGRTDYSLVQEVFHRHQIPPTPENYARFFDAYVFLLADYLGEGLGGPHEGVAQWMRDLRTITPRPLTGLLTGNIRLGAEIKLRHYNLWEHFELGGFADDHMDRNEIAVAAFRRGSAALGRNLRGDEALVVGDTPRDIACARHIGARVLAVATGPCTVEELSRHEPDWVTDTLEALPVEKVVKRSPASGKGP